uniref:Smr domain-containing protein n=2 Tax=Caenorhabditis tropicalis TaxID=1561998 RepID=A0A1I7TUE2_9PELO
MRILCTRGWLFNTRFLRMLNFTLREFDWCPISQGFDDVEGNEIEEIRLGKAHTLQIEHSFFTLSRRREEVIRLVIKEFLFHEDFEVSIGKQGPKRLEKIVKRMKLQWPFRKVFLNYRVLRMTDGVPDGLIPKFFIVL